ncbi:MAG: BLUF domain-containing protein [Myxococcales bacterium]|nr:BLUF domain-containing protein [Myxococcales bacterium]
MTSPSVRQLLYVSLATGQVSGPALMALVEQARTRNASLGVTGVLLHQAGSFLQVIEGDPEAVDALYRRIAVDPRHRHVVMLLRQTVPERSFARWSLGYIDVTATAGRLPGFRPGMAISDLVGNPATLLKLVAEFRSGHWWPSIATA